MEQSCLIIIDIQNDYFKEGKNPLKESEEAASKAKMVIDKFRRSNLPVIFIQHLSVREGSSFFIPGTSGAEIYPLVKPCENEQIISKNFPNSFRNTNLQEYLLEIKVKNLVICGMMTHMCVNATTRAAKDLGYNCTVIGDACATKDLEINNVKIEAKHVHYSFLAALNYYDAAVTNAESFIKSFN